MNDMPKSSLVFNDLQKSAQFLEDTLAQPKNDYMRAAAIQAFEICFELAWKYLQARLRESGLDAYSPRDTFRKAGKAGFIDDVEAWLGFVGRRNLTVHTYNPDLADAIYAAIRSDFLPAVKSVLSGTPPENV